MAEHIKEMKIVTDCLSLEIKCTGKFVQLAGTFVWAWWKYHNNWNVLFIGWFIGCVGEMF